MHSYLHLFPDDNVGIFMAFNSQGREGAAGAMRQALFDEFTDRYFPGHGRRGGGAAGNARRPMRA